MSEKALDRRIQKTLQHLQNALAELIAEKDYEDITIQDILDRANVGRSTFYAHFENKDQLLRSILTRLNEEFEAGIRRLSAEHASFEDNSADMPLRVVQFVEQNRRLFQAMLGKQRPGVASNPLYDYLYTVTWEHHRQMIQMQHGDPVRLEVAAHYYTSAFIGALMWWLERDLIYSAEEFSQLLNQFALPGLNKVFGDDK